MNKTKNIKSKNNLPVNFNDRMQQLMLSCVQENEKLQVVKGELEKERMARDVALIATKTKNLGSRRSKTVKQNQLMNNNNVTSELMSGEWRPSDCTSNFKNVWSRSLWIQSLIRDDWPDEVIYGQSMTTQTKLKMQCITYAIQYGMK